MKKNCFAAILFLSLAVGCAFAAKDEKSQTPKSIAVTEYTGDEEKPVTLPAGFKLTRESLMKNVDDNTAVIIVYNGTGRDLSYFQFDLERPGTGKRAGYILKGFHGLGPLLKGEKRIIKLKGRAPFLKIRLCWDETARFHYTYFKGGVPHLFTLKEKKAGAHVKATWTEWGNPQARVYSTKY